MRLKIFFITFFSFSLVFAPLSSSFAVAEISTEEQIENLTKQILILQIEILKKQLVALQQSVNLAEKDDEADMTIIVPVVKVDEPPKITSISPVEGFNGIDITLEGEWFTPKGNTVYTTFETFQNVSSSNGGKKIKLDLSYYGPGFENSFGGTSKQYSLPVFIYVENIYGRSNAAEFKLFFDVNR